MSFASFQFVAFFPIVVALYYLCPKQYRWLLLLLASCYFYMAFIPKYIIVLFTLIAVDYTMALFIERSSGLRRKQYLLVSILTTVGILFVFKYFNFFNMNVTALAHFLDWNYSPLLLSIALPLGLSFHTFQSLSYVIEVYRGKFKAEKNVLMYGLYVMFFPQLIAGPIERPQHLLPQFRKPAPFSWERTMSGLRRMLWGYFKKLVIADRLGMSVDYVWSNFSHLSGLSVVLTMVFFLFQLYADFSGYCDIAVGCARILGYDIVENFEQPFAARSIAEFWRRWHISLSTWFRDYMFTPLALFFGRRTTRIGIYIALLISFTLMGLWHGANWTYITMGLLFGLYIVVEMVIKKPREALYNFIGLAKVPWLLQAFEVVVTFLLVAVTDVFFRAPSIDSAFAFISQTFVDWRSAFSSVPNLVYSYFTSPYKTLGFSQSDLLIACGAIVVLLSIEMFQERHVLKKWFKEEPLFVQSFLFAGLALTIFIFAVMNTTQFIYFQF